MELHHGTEEEHLGTLQRAHDAELDYIWSGDVRRNPYLAENLAFAQEKGFIELKEVSDAQESGWTVEWLKDPNEYESTH